MLTIHASLGGSHNGTEELKKELLHPDLLRALFEEAMNELSVESLDYGALWKFREATVQAVDENLLAK